MDILQIPSPNFLRGRRGYTPHGIVIHIMEGTLEGTAAWFQDTRSGVSSHYGVGRDGDIHQYVDERNTAYHAGKVVRPTWEHLLLNDRDHPINPNLYTIGIEHEGRAGDEWTPEMYTASALLVRRAADTWGIPIERGRIIGHREIRADKSCPGSGVDLDYLIELAKGRPAA